LDREAAGRLFRTAWINGVRKHYPGTPKDGYVAPWEDMPEWERQSAQAVAELVVRFVQESDNGTAKLTREQRGQFVATAWLAQMYKHFPDPKPSYVSPWAEMPVWQQETDSDLFGVIEQAVRAESS
jgi:hypothetical protein